MIQVRQTFDATRIYDLPKAIRDELSAPGIRSCIRPGDRVAVCVGSRGIHKIDEIVLSVLENLHRFGASPFLVPAMGSHGGATGAGQRKVLASYGITEKTMGVPIRASMETVCLGNSASGIPVYFSKEAYEADWILPINRVKAHTDFSGPIESGLMKMLTIGLGKEKGCSTLHRCGTNRFAQIIPEAAQTVLATGKVRFGLALVENGYEQTAIVRAIRGEALLQEEPLLLQRAKAMMPRLPFSHIDVLVVEEFGKDISGSGMDPNITGRRSAERIAGFQGPDIQQIVVLRLTEPSHGNAIAINAADFITRAFFEKIDLPATYKNSLACCNPASGKIPVIAQDEEEAVAFAISCCRGIDPKAPRIVRIRNTLALDQFWISESLLEEAQSLAGIEVLA
ncbi:MAG: DUF2088 domain-containing protein [Lawsonibacter sp.]|nr:DUF2088 domain-containing protein [Lawsonibacter sp.]